MMTTYPPSIDVYHKACDEILSWMKDWLSQSEFDRLSTERRPQQNSFVGYTGDTILMPLHGDPNLALLQEMQRAKLVEAESDENGYVYYRRVAE